MSRQGVIVGALALFIGLIVLGASPFFVLDVTQTAIVVQLGKPVRNVTEAGLYMKVPFIEEVTYFDKRLLDYESDAQDVITQDKKTLLLDNFAKWRITDPLKVYQAFQTQRGALQRLHDIIYSELRVELGLLCLDAAPVYALQTIPGVLRLRLPFGIKFERVVQVGPILADGGLLNAQLRDEMIGHAGAGYAPRCPWRRWLYRRHDIGSRRWPDRRVGGRYAGRL